MERLLAWYRVSSSAGAVVALVVANLVPLAGVLWFGWSMTIIFGAFAVMITGAQLFALLILIALKTGVDLAFHLREHREPLPSTISLGQ